MKKVLFFTGAGISAESGIPTFAEQEGIREKLTREFALNNPEEFRRIIKQMCDAVNGARPNVAHRVIAKCNYPVITMNVDRLHQKAGSKKVIELHGRLPEPHELYADNFNLLKGLPVLYGDEAPAYADAEVKVRQMEKGDKLVIVGVSFYTGISEYIRDLALLKGVDVQILNECATVEVPEICERLVQDGYTGL